MKRLWHKIQHMFGWNTGKVETFLSEEGVLMVGFRCSCGELLSVDVCHTLTMDTNGELK